MGMHWCGDAGTIGMCWCRDAGAVGMQWGCVAAGDAGTTEMQWGCIGAGMLGPQGCNGDALLQGMRHHGSAWPCCCCRTPRTPLPAPSWWLLCTFCMHGAASSSSSSSSSHALRSLLLEQHVGLCTHPTHNQPPLCTGEGGQWWGCARGGGGCHAAPPADLEALLADLRSFLLLLDRESLSAAARAKKQSVGELLQRLQGPAGERNGEQAVPGGHGGGL